MTDPQPLDRITIANEQSLSTLARAITYSQGEFSLILARCNYATLRKKIMQQLQERCPFEIQELDLSPSSQTLYTAIKSELGDEHPSALMVFGLEDVDDLDAVLTSTNQVREEFRKEFTFPLVFWINDTILQKLIKLVPDLESWSTSVEFEMATQDLLECLQKTTDEIFASVVEAGAGPFQANNRFELGTGTVRWGELEFAQKDLDSREIVLEPELAASFEFVLGRTIAHSMERSRQHYEQSLALWQNSSNLERQGYVLFNLGVWWRTYATQHRYEFEQACQRASQYFRRAVEAFDQVHRSELVAKFINPLGEVLQRLEQWEELETVARRSLVLNQTYSDFYRQADAHGLLATVAVSKTNWKTAKQEAETALQLLETAIQAEPEPLSSEKQVFLNWEKAFKQGWYLLALGKAQWHLGQQQDAIRTLELAQAETRPDYDPSLYIQILQELRSLYFEQKDYIKAFDTRMLYRSIEQQYGFRAFVGAGRLQPHKAIINPALVGADGQAELSQEISASGRQQDVNRLIERLGRSDQKLTVLHGQSGVGKSSILQAGLVPALNPVTFDTREVVTILLQVYTTWSEQLGQELLKALHSFERLSLPDCLNSPSVILEQLRHSVNQNLMVVLIFDQFEEFFFVYKDPTERKTFYEFLKNCLNIPYVKVILSLREDYLHYLLECNDRLVNLDIINNNILDKNILFYLGNFTHEDARSVIKALTQDTPMPLEQPLIDQVVDDLSEELGEVRPIELQITGAQLQSENITTLQQYQERGPKDALVGRFLEEVTKDCGLENEQFAKLVLYLLTDENNTRPLKTRADLAMELNVAEKLDLILIILVKAGLVFRIPAFPADRYQLVHDYLVLFVRQKQSAQLIGELEKEREQRKLTEAKLNQALTKQLRTARRATYSLAALVAAIGSIAVIAGLIGINSYTSSQRLTSSQNRELDRVVSALKTGKILQRFPGIIPEVQMLALSELNQATSNVRMINRFNGHTDEITEISFSADSQLIASASKDTTVRIWRRDGSLVARLDHPAAVTAVSINRDNTKIVTASEDSNVRLWSINGSLLKTLNGHTASVTDVAFSPDGTQIVSSSKDKTLRIWNPDGELLREIPAHETEIAGIRFNADGTLLASFANYDPVKVWNTQDFTEISKLDSYNTLQVEFGKNDQTIIVIRRDGSIQHYTLKGDLIAGNRVPIYYLPAVVINAQISQGLIAASVEKRSLKTISLGGMSLWGKTIGLEHDDSITAMRFSPDSTLLVSASKDNRLTVWDVQKAVETLDTRSQDEETNVLSMRLSPNEKTVVLGRANDTLTLMDSNGSITATIPGHPRNFSFSPDSQAIVTPSTENVIKVWTLGGEEIELRDSDNKIVKHAISPDGKSIITGSENGFISLWTPDGTRLKTWQAHTEKLETLAFSPDGEIIISGDKYTVKLWQKDGVLINVLPTFSSIVEQVIVSPDGQTFLTAEEQGAPTLWRKDGTKSKELLGHEERFIGATFSSNGKIFLTLGSSIQGNHLKLWRSDGTLIETIEDAGDIYNAEFSPDGTKLFVPSYSGSVKVFNLDGTPQTTLKGHFGRVRDIDVSPDGATIATASEDNTVRLWDRQGNAQEIFRDHASEVLGVSFSPDGRSIASIDRDNVVKLWDLNGRTPQTLKTDAIEVSASDPSANYKIEFSPDGEIITAINIFYGQANNSVQRVTSWNRKGEIIHQFSSQGDDLSFLETKEYIKNIKIANHRTVALMSQDSALKVWSVSGQLISTLKGHTRWINGVSFSTDGQLIASASDDKTVKVWNKNGTMLATIRHNDMVNGVSFSHDGQIIATASKDKIVRLWDIKGKLIRPLPGHTDQVSGVLFHPDEQTLISSSLDNTIRLWRISDGTELEKIDVPSESTDTPNNLGFLSVSADGKTLALGADKVYVRLLNGTWLKQATFTALDSFPQEGLPTTNSSIKVTGNSGVMVLTLSLDDVMRRGCDWVRAYLRTNANVEEGDRTLCDDISP